MVVVSITAAVWPPRAGDEQGVLAKQCDALPLLFGAIIVDRHGPVGHEQRQFRPLAKHMTPDARAPGVEAPFSEPMESLASQPAPKRRSVAPWLYRTLLGSIIGN